MLSKFLFLKILFFSCVVFIYQPLALANGPVWKVSNGDQYLFIGGTIHALSPEDYPLPSSFGLAYQQADTLVFEVDVEEVKSPKFQQQMLRQMTLPRGQSLRTLLSPNVYQTLEQFLASRGGDIRTVEHFKPGMLSILLTIDELSRLGQLGQGVDDFYYHQAIKDGKGLQYLETIDQQISFLAGMGEGNEDLLILHTIKETQELSTFMRELKVAWRKGDQAQMELAGLSYWIDDFPKMYQDLLVTRNNAWMPSIRSMLTTSDIEYVLVGALHLVGNDGLLKQLRSEGYHVQKVKDKR